MEHRVKAIKELAADAHRRARTKLMTAEIAENAEKRIT
jgi:hypothetical protein